MGYRKIYYEDILNVDAKASSVINDWEDHFAEIKAAIQGLCEYSGFRGEGSEAIKQYLSEVYLSTLFPAINALGKAYLVKLADYYDKYKCKVDRGDEAERWTTIMSDEIKKNGTVHGNLKRIAHLVDECRSDATKIKRSIADLAVIREPGGDGFQRALEIAARTAVNLDEKADTYETSRKGDLNDIRATIQGVTAILNRQLSNERVSVAAYTAGKVTEMCDHAAFIAAIGACGAVAELLKIPSNLDEVLRKVTPADYARLNGMWTDASQSDDPVEEFLRRIKELSPENPLRNLRKDQIEILTDTFSGFEGICIHDDNGNALVIFAGTNGNTFTDLMNTYIHISQGWESDQERIAKQWIDDLSKKYDNIVVTGYSLGGYLAQEVTLDGNPAVKHCITFEPAARNIYSAISNVKNPNVRKIKNYTADGSFVSGDIFRVTIGESEGYQVEENWVGPAYNHNIYILADSLEGEPAIENVWINSESACGGGGW